MNVVSPQESLELVGLAAAGDSEAQRRLIGKLKPRLSTIARSILGNTEDAEDTTGAILVELLSCISNFRGENFLGWVDRIAVRTAIRHARQRRIRATRYESHDSLDEYGALDESQGAHEALPKKMLEYLALLPEAQRVAVVLRHVMDYSVDEIAAIAEVSPNTVKDRLLRGREQLRKVIRRDLRLVPSTRNTNEP
jgi:RNA polymerase sigma-70 factor (ECF subfamily)